MRVETAQHRNHRRLPGASAHRPIVTVLPVGADDYLVAIEDRRDGREHVMHTADDLEPWFESFNQGRCLQPSKGFCDCCGELHSDRDTDGQVFELCMSCQAALTAANFEEDAA